mgnify:CR=1 FL=1
MLTTGAFAMVAQFVGSGSLRQASATAKPSSVAAKPM